MSRAKRSLEASANVHSGAFRPLATGPEAMDALVGAAMQETATLTLAELREGDWCVDALVGGAQRAGMVPLLEVGTTSPIVDTSGNLEAWIKEGNSKWKKGLRASRRKMGKKHEAVFEVARSPRDVERCFETEVSAFELFGGDADWKARLATSQRPHATPRAYRRNAAGFARYAYRAALRPRLRSAYRRLRPST